MERVFFFIIFLIMTPPALLSLVFASRHWFAILWNGFWYLCLSEVAIRAFDSENAKYVGLVFLLVYFYRAIVKPKPTIRFQFQNLNRYGPRSTRSRPPSPERDVHGEVLEAEYKRIDYEPKL